MVTIPLVYLKAFMKDFPHIKSLYCRNDNATCYSGSPVLMAKKEVCDKVGMKLLSLDFNDAQKEKDQCDIDGAIADASAHLLTLAMML